MCFILFCCLMLGLNFFKIWCILSRNAADFSGYPTLGNELFHNPQKKKKGPAHAR